MKVERKDEGAWTSVYIYPNSDRDQMWFAHRITIGRFDLDDNDQPVPPQPNISLLGFGGGVDHLPQYIEALQEVERQARAIREEKHAEYEAWRASLKEQSGDRVR